MEGEEGGERDDHGPVEDLFPTDQQGVRRRGGEERTVRLIPAPRTAILIGAMIN